MLDQPEFLNACLQVETDSIRSLLDACKEVESVLGGRGGPRHGPRVLDVDLLLVGISRFRSERLTLPHPEVSRALRAGTAARARPGLTLPDGTRLADALDALGTGQEVRRVGAPLI